MSTDAKQGLDQHQGDIENREEADRLAREGFRKLTARTNRPVVVGDERPSPHPSRQTLDQRRQDFEDVLQALEIDQRHREMLTAAASAWAKAAAVHATCSYIDARRSDPTSLGPN